MEKKLHVEGMMCMHCKASVEKALAAVNGVTAVEVDLDSKSAKVICEPAVTDEELIAAVVKKGFQASVV